MKIINKECETMEQWIEKLVEKTFEEQLAKRLVEMRFRMEVERILEKEKGDKK